MKEAPVIARYGEGSRAVGAISDTPRNVSGGRKHSGLEGKRVTQARSNRGLGGPVRGGPGRTDDGFFGSIRDSVHALNGGGNLSSDPERATEQMLQEDWSRLRDQGLPILDSIFGGINDTSIVDSAKKDAASRLGTTQERVDRSMGRRGTQMSPAQRKMLQDRMQSSVTAGNTANISQARINQNDVNQSRMNQTLSTMAALRSDSGATLSNIAGQQIQREQANARARAQSSSGFGSMLGTLAGGAIGAFGGPMGVAAGASIGGSIGGGI